MSGLPPLPGPPTPPPIPIPPPPGGVSSARRNLIVSRIDWGQDPAASISGGAWEPQLPAENMLKIQAQLVAQAIGTSVTFSLNLGAARNIDIVHLQRLIIDPGAFITVSVAGYSTGPVTAWPSDAAGVYEANYWNAIGRPRIFVMPSTLQTSSVTITVNGGVAPLQIGYVGACEGWLAPVNMDYGWKIATFDESDVQKTPFGSVYVTRRARRRRLNLGVGFLRQGGIYGTGTDQVIPPLEGSAIAGRSSPVIAVPMPDDTGNIERYSVWGLSTIDQEFANPMFATWATAYQIDQLV